MQKFSELKIIISNCLYKGSSWLTVKDLLINIIRDGLQAIDDLEFRGVNVNDVRGDHTSFTIIIAGVFYRYSQQQNKESMLDLEILSVHLMQKIPDLTFAEIRVEHTRHMSEFQALQHPQLARTY